MDVGPEITANELMHRHGENRGVPCTPHSTFQAIGDPSGRWSRVAVMGMWGLHP